MDSLELSITDLGEGGWHGVGESVGESSSSADCGIERGALGDGTIVG